MKKIIANMTVAKSIGSFYEAILKSIFKDRVTINSYSVEENNYCNMENADLYLITSTATLQELSFIPKNAQVVLSSLTFTKDCIERLKKFPFGTKAYLINTTGEMTIESIADINRLGVKNMEFVPVYPGVSEYEQLNLAVTVGEVDLVPTNVKEVFNTGNRVIAGSVIIDIALKLNMLDILDSEEFLSYNKSLAVNSFAINDLSKRASNIESKFENLLSAMSEGILGVDTDDNIFAFNQAAERIFSVNHRQVLQKNVQEVSKLLPIECFEKLSEINTPQTKLICVRGVDIALTITPIQRHGIYRGYFTTIKRFSDEEKKQQQLRLQLLGKGYKSKYTFDDIIGECTEIKSAKNIAEKMAKTDASILLTGESGTGKELFAHAIHNSSLRRDMPFVAINCAALPDNLLESELFGYDEGAFTGAKKGGKLGLFEYAHNGTLFLDEIEDMSRNLQVKLLRVLQEREIMRVGGDRIISVDVRIIAASNKDIYQQVENGEFRKDLYYRLNTLPIDIPPLRMRGNDILLIFEIFKQKTNAHFTLTPEAQQALLEYSWDGNIRELHNIVEYLKYSDIGTITCKELPLSIKRNATQNKILKQEPKVSVIDEFYLLCGKKLEQANFIIQCIHNASQCNSIVGRRQIAAFATLQGIKLSEQEIRTLVSNLQKGLFLELIESKRGFLLTEKGEILYQSLERRVEY